MEPLNLPRGSVRAIITLTLCVGFVPVCIFGPEAGLAAYSALIGVAVRDYFGTRAGQNRQDGPPLPEPVS